MRERVIEKYLENKVDEAGGLCLKLNPLWFIGIPDRLVLLPQGRVLFIELKAPGEAPRKIQLSVHERLRRLGFTVLVIDNKEQIKF